jgi:hypothetical protein
VSNTHDDGGPAFAAGYHPEGNSADHPGMSLRDYFAATAMTAIPHCGDGPELDSGDFARACYEWADAMLDARKAKR